MARSKMVMLLTVLMAFICRQRVFAEADAQVEQTVVYKGRVRSSKWIDEQYERFKDKIAKVDGRYYLAVIKLNHAGKRLTSLPDVPSKGEIFYLGRGSVLSILTPDSALIYVWRNSAVFEVYQIVDISTDGWVSEQPLPNYTVVVTGTYEYRSADGTKRTVARVEPIRGITRKEFVQALEQGIELKHWICEEFRCVKCRGTGKTHKKKRPSSYGAYRYVTGRCPLCKGTGRRKNVRLEVIP